MENKVFSLNLHMLKTTHENFSLFFCGAENRTEGLTHARQVGILPLSKLPAQDVFNQQN